MLGDIRAWIGFVHVQPLGEQQPFEEGTLGGFTHAMAVAADADQFRERVVSALSNFGQFAVEFSDVAPMADYYAEDRISEEVEKLAAELSPSDPVQFDIFDTYRQHDS